MEEKSKKRKKTDWLGTVGLSLILTAAVLLIWFFLQGQTTVEGNGMDVTKDRALSCASETVKYPYFNTSADKTEAKVTVLYNGSDFKSMSLIYTQFFGNRDSVTAAEATNRFAMSKTFGQNGMDANSFGMAFSMQEDRLIYSIYADKSELIAGNGKYFLADNLNYSSSFEAFTENYEKLGFNCNISE